MTTTALTIRFEGLCCHVKKNDASEVRRTILPDASSHQHISYIEFFADDFSSTDNPSFETEPYTVENFSYLRTAVTNKKIALKTPVVTQGFDVTKSYKDRIPQLRKIEPNFTAVKDELLANPVPSGIVAAYFDMPDGVLSSGPSEGRKTRFNPQNDWPEGRVGEWAQLDLEVDGNIEFDVTDLDTNDTQTLKLKPGTTLVTIGNQTEEDILHTPGLPAEGHFPVYYKLSKTDLGPAANLPKPEIGLGLGIGCSNSNYP